MGIPRGLGAIGQARETLRPCRSRLATVDTPIPRPASSETADYSRARPPCTNAMTDAALTIRPSTDSDLPAITAIYAWHVENGTGTFELEVPDAAEMGRRREDVLGKGLPWLVAERS